MVPKWFNPLLTFHRKTGRRQNMADILQNQPSILKISQNLVNWWRYSGVEEFLIDFEFYQDVFTFEAEFNRVFDDDFVFEPFSGFWVALTSDFQ